MIPDLSAGTWNEVYHSLGQTGFLEDFHDIVTAINGSAGRFPYHCVAHQNGEVGRFPAMAVKLKGVMANTKPSRARYSEKFHSPLGEIRGCCS